MSLMTTTWLNVQSIKIISSITRGLDNDNASVLWLSLMASNSCLLNFHGIAKPDGAVEVLV